MTIDALGLAEVIIDVVIRHYGFSDFIVSDCELVFTLKFWSSLCYFLGIKQKLSTAFHLQTDGQTERQNSMMEVYFQAFVNNEQDDSARPLRIAEFAYNNAKNTSIGHTPFEPNCGFHSRSFYKKEVDFPSRSRTADALATELRDLISVCRKNFQHAQELQKRYHNKHAKPRSYALGEKVWLNSQYIKTKRNRKLEAKFFGLFRVLHPVRKQVYILELPKKWRIHDVFHLSLIEKDTTRKRQVGETISLLEVEGNGDGDGEEYEIEAIRDSEVYTRESESHLPGFYYLISWKGYPKEKNTWEPSLAIQHLRRLVRTFHKEHLEKSTATSTPVNSASPMAKPAVKPGSANKQK